MLNYWTRPTSGTTDLLTNCPEREGYIEGNANGTQKAFSGKRYAGAYFYTYYNYREYIQGVLTSKLEKDKKYRVSFYVSLAERSQYALQSFQVLLTNNLLSIQTDKPLAKSRLKKNFIGEYQYVNIDLIEPISDTNSWVKIEVSFIAKGFEKFISFGNFQSDSSIKKKKLKGDDLLAMSYYFIDNIDVKLENEIVISSKTYEVDKPYKINNIEFEFDKAVLLDKSIVELEKLYNIFKELNYNIRIQGHTDNEGDDSYNKTLSAKRAAAVVNFLVKKGIDKDRLSYIGYGEKKPIATNDTEAGRQKNRRVEFVITKL